MQLTRCDACIDLRSHRRPCRAGVEVTAGPDDLVQTRCERLDRLVLSGVAFSPVRSPLLSLAHQVGHVGGVAVLSVGEQLPQFHVDLCLEGPSAQIVSSLQLLADTVL